MDSPHDPSRRTFLQSVGAAVPTLTLLRDGIPAMGAPVQAPASQAPTKFTPIDLTARFTTSAVDFGPRPQANALSQTAARDGLIRVLGGRQVFRGIPFQLGPSEVNQKSWVMISTKEAGGAVPRLEVEIGQRASHVCLAQFCDWDPSETPAPDAEDVTEQVGQHLADVVLVYADGSEHVFPIRRRFEVNALSVNHLSFLALPHRSSPPSKQTDPLEHGNQWGYLQVGVWDQDLPGPLTKGLDRATLWLAALENPTPDRIIKAVRFQATAADPLLVCGVTLFHGRVNPLRHERLTLCRITLPDATTVGELDGGRWKIDVDLGQVVRTFLLRQFAPETWLAAQGTAGLGPTDGRHLYIDLVASRDATLTLRDTRSGREYGFDLSQAGPGVEVEGRPAGGQLQLLYPDKTWLHCTVVDGTTKRATPVRLAFRSKEGRYIPPYGHRTEINTGWFQDYGADVSWGGNSYAYVDGQFQAELPVGEVYLEMTKGFEYAAVRQRLEIKPGQRELTVEIPRFADLRARGWVTADTHVHFLPPTTAVLEGQAEGVNLVNLLAAQWGDLFTNVGDLWQGSLASADKETLVRMGTENRQHLLGHLGLLGSAAGKPVFPMSAAGPSESYLGDPLWTSMSDWADECRQRDGVVVAVHFPKPTAEVAAEVALNRIDAVELVGIAAPSHLIYQDWYRYLNCGYRLAAVGGTDKMNAGMALGQIRTYAYIGQAEFTFANWARAVRGGNTFMTLGPLLLFEVDGRAPGTDITMRAGGGSVEVRAEVMNREPVRRVEVIWNGRVVASLAAPPGSGRVVLQEKISVSGPGWLAARCLSLREPPAVIAHTSPVYVQVPGRDLFSGPAAMYMLTLIEGAESWAKQLATRPDAERFTRVLDTFTTARERLHQRLHAHGIAH